MTLDFGIRASKPGDDVKTALDKNIQFSSKFSTLKIISKDDAQLTTDGSGNGSVSIPHGLNYAPGHYVLMKGTAQHSTLDASSYPNSFVPITPVGSSWISDANFMDCYTDDTNLVITATGAMPSTTYHFRYYIFVDLAQSFTGDSGIVLTNDFGMKVSKPGKDVKTAEEYELIYSNRYKSLQYYEVNYKTQDISLPLMFSDAFDNPIEAGTYVDFIHGLGYAPFFLAWAFNVAFNNGPNTNVFLPHQEGRGNLATGESGSLIIDGFCDADRIRISFIETSGNSNNYANGPIYIPQTLTIKCIPFAESLTS